jgi:ankyrin repeat protein
MQRDQINVFDKIVRRIEVVLEDTATSTTIEHELVGPVLEYLELDGDPNELLPKSRKTLLIACIESCPNFGPSLELLARGADANVDYFGTTPLMYAATRRHPGAGVIVSALLAAGAVAAMSNYKYKTALNLAIEAAFDRDRAPAEARGSECAVLALLSGGAHVDSFDLDGCTPLSQVAGLTAGDPGRHDLGVALAGVLIAWGADVNLGTPLHEACGGSLDSSSSIAMAGVLLDAGANIDVADCFGGGGTALHQACSLGHKQIAMELIRRGANVDAVDDGMECPVHYAAKRGHAGMVHILANAGADLDALDACGVSPLLCAEGDGVVCALLANGASLEDLRKNASHLLLRACQGLASCKNARGKYALIDLLVREGGDLDDVDGEQRTPLDYIMTAPDGKDVHLLARLWPALTQPQRARLAQSPSVVADAFVRGRCVRFALALVDEGASPPRLPFGSHVAEPLVRGLMAVDARRKKLETSLSIMMVGDDHPADLQALGQLMSFGACQLLWRLDGWERRVTSPSKRELLCNAARARAGIVLALRRANAGGRDGDGDAEEEPRRKRARTEETAAQGGEPSDDVIKIIMANAGQLVF